MLSNSVARKRSSTLARHNGDLVKSWLYKDQLEPVAEIDADTGDVTRFVYASRKHVPDLMVLDDGTVYRLFVDHLGSVRAVAELDGDIVQTIQYDPWGVPDVAPMLPFGFAGGLYDADTQLVRFGTRDYDASVGRWTAKDPLRFDGSENFFGYSADPINAYDLTGEAQCKLTKECMQQWFQCAADCELEIGKKDKEYGPCKVCCLERRKTCEEIGTSITSEDSCVEIALKQKHKKKKVKKKKGKK